MRARFAITLVLLASTAFGQNTQKMVTAPIPSSVSHWVTMTGNDLYPICLAWQKTENNGGQEEADTVIKGQTCYAFVLGVINTYPASTSSPDGTTNDQIVDVATNYLKEHPAERSKGAWELILKSEEQAFALTLASEVDLSRIGGPLSPIQLRELAARFAAINLNVEPRPEFASEIDLSKEECKIKAARPDQVHCPAWDNQLLGRIMYTLAKDLLKGIRNGEEIAELVKSGQYTFLTTPDGTFDADSMELAPNSGF